jgi:hypothetical protein
MVVNFSGLGIACSVGVVNISFEIFICITVATNGSVGRKIVP